MRFDLTVNEFAREVALGAGNIATILTYADGHQTGVFLLGLPQAAR